MKDQGSGSLRSPQLSLSPTILTFVQAFVLTRTSAPFQRAPSHNNAHGEWLAQSHTFLPSKSVLWGREFFFFFVSRGGRRSGCATKVRRPCPNTVPHGHVDRARWREGAAWPSAGPASRSRNYVITERFWAIRSRPRHSVTACDRTVVFLVRSYTYQYQKFKIHPFRRPAPAVTAHRITFSSNHHQVHLF